jgi:hypothetical protein
MLERISRPRAERRVSLCRQYMPYLRNYALRSRISILSERVLIFQTLFSCSSASMGSSSNLRVECVFAASVPYPCASGPSLLLPSRTRFVVIVIGTARACCFGARYIRAGEVPCPCGPRRQCPSKAEARTSLRPQTCDRLVVSSLSILITPAKVLEPCRCQLGVSHGVLDRGALCDRKDRRSHHTSGPDAQAT